MKNDKYYLKLEEEGRFNNLDKRVKEYKDYKDWKNEFDKRSVGLGDTIAKITKATGVEKLVKAVVGEDCGCDERKKKLNKIWKYSKLNCIEDKDYLFITNFLKKNKQKVTPKEQQLVIDVYNNIFGTKIKTTNCASCFKGHLRNLERYLEVYNG